KNNNNMRMILEKCTKEDFENYYFLKCDSENILWAGHKIAPDKEKLYLWFKEQLKRKDRIMFLAKSNNDQNIPLGYLYLDIIGIAGDCVEISYGVYSKFVDQGIGTKIIKFAIDYCTNNLEHIKNIIGWVAIDNIRSVKCFRKNKFAETNETKKIFFKGFNQEVSVKKFIYVIKI
ncbi:MAG: GNAT family N-acetyltransferase, partial [Promethearchaeota archaeon]